MMEYEEEECGEEELTWVKSSIRPWASPDYIPPSAIPRPDDLSPWIHQPTVYPPWGLQTLMWCWANTDSAEKA